MMQYVNAFNCSLSENGRTVAIHFQQEEPYMPNPEVDNPRTEVRRNDVADIVLERDCAQGLIDILTQLFAQSQEEQ